MRPVLALALTTAAVLVLTTPMALAKDKKPVKNAKIEAAIAKLYDGSIDLTDNAKREPLFLEIDKYLAKDKKSEAIKSPGFWVRSVQNNYFSNSKARPAGKKKRIVETKMPVLYKNLKTGEVPLFFHAGASYQNKSPATLVVSILPEGTDPEAYLEQQWLSNDVVKKNWIVAAVAESKEYPVSKEPLLAVYPFVHMREQFNTDSNKWFLEGVGTAGTAVQNAAISVFPDRLAGIVLREPKEAVTHANTSLYTSFVVHQGPPPAPAEGEEAPKVDEAKLKADREAAEKVAKAYEALEADRHSADLDAANATASIVKWVSEHPGRTLRQKYTYETTMGEESGEPFSGSLKIVSPAKRGEPTKLTVEYDTAAGAVNIDSENLGEFIVYMNDDLLDLDQPVSIVVNGTELVSKTFERNFREMFAIADDHGEYGRVFPAYYRAFAPSTETDAGDGPAEGGGEGEKKDGDGE